MPDDMGASPDGDRAAAPSGPSPSVSGVAGIPSADDPRLRRRMFGYGDSGGRPRSISKAHRELLRSFTDPIARRLAGMSDEELWQFIDAGNSVSMTNCGWDEYAIAKTYLDTAKWLMRERATVGEAETPGT